MVLLIHRVTVRTIFNICVRKSPSNPCFFNKSICIHNTLLLRDVTAKSWYFPEFIILTSPHERAADHITRIFEVTMQATKSRTLVEGKDYFWCRRLLLPSMMSLLFQINSLLPKNIILMIEILYLLQKVLKVSGNYFPVDPTKKLLITVFTWISLFVSVMVVITHDIQPVTA